MKFCPNCDMMLYLCIAQQEGVDASKMFCRQCAHSESMEDVGRFHVSSIKPKKKEFKVSKFAWLDPTLPLVTMKCGACDHSTAVAIRYDDQEMLYVYCCQKCGTQHTNGTHNK